MISLDLKSLTRTVTLLALMKGSFSLAIPDDAGPSITVTPDPPSNSTDDGSSGSTNPSTQPASSYDWSPIPKAYVDEVLEYYQALQVENSTLINPGPHKRGMPPKHLCDEINEWIQRSCKPDVDMQAWEDECKPASAPDYQIRGSCPRSTYCTEVETVEGGLIVIDIKCAPHKQPRKDNWNGVAQYGYRHVHADYPATLMQHVPIKLMHTMSGVSVSAHVETSLEEYVIPTATLLTGNKRDHDEIVCLQHDQVRPDFINCLPYNRHTFASTDIVDFTFGLLLHQVGIFLYYIGQ